MRKSLILLLGFGLASLPSAWGRAPVEIYLPADAQVIAEESAPGDFDGIYHLSGDLASIAAAAQRQAESRGYTLAQSDIGTDSATMLLEKGDHQVLMISLQDTGDGIEYAVELDHELSVNKRKALR